MSEEAKVKALLAEVESLTFQLRDVRVELGVMKEDLEKKDRELLEAQAINQQLQIRLRQYQSPGTQTGRYNSRVPLYSNLPRMNGEEAAEMCLKAGNPVAHVEPELEDVPGYQGTLTGRLMSEPNWQEIPKPDSDEK